MSSLPCTDTEMMIHMHIQFHTESSHSSELTELHDEKLLDSSAVHARSSSCELSQPSPPHPAVQSQSGDLLSTTN